MDELLLRLTVLARVLVPFACMMATVYLATHILFARLVARPDSPVLWFFSTVTAPLTWPVRAVLPAGIAERRVRGIALVVYLVLWVVTGRLLRGGGGGPGG